MNLRDCFVRMLVGLAVAVIATPAVGQTAMRYLGDENVYELPLELLSGVADDIELNAGDFVRKYYEPLRARMPKYVSRDSIGMDDTGRYTMWCYTFTPRHYRQTVYLQAGIHGRNEFESYFAAALIMRLIADARKSHDPHLKYLRRRVRFVVVPVVNVSDTYDRAHPPFNSRNININRDWVDERTQEMRNLKAVLRRYEPGEIQMAFDLHTDPEGMPGWGAYLLPFAKGIPSEVSDKLLSVSNFLYEQNIPGKVQYRGEDLYRAFMGPNTEYPKSSRDWRENGPENYQRRGSGTGGTCTSGIWNTFGIPCSTLEHGARKFGPKGSPVELTRAIELYLNHIAIQME